MSGAADVMLARIETEISEKQAFQNGLLETAQNENRDLNSNEMELYQRAADRMTDCEQQAKPLRESIRIAADSNQRSRELAEQLSAVRTHTPQSGPVEYRSAGAYIADMYYSQLGDPDASQRIAVYTRAAAHQTTVDNPGLLPESIVAPVVNFIEVARPITNTLGPTDLGNGSWSYARVTQHTSVGLQAGEKTELPSRKMLITKTPLGAETYGGYVNVSKQDIARTSPGILDMVIADLASQYAIATEEATGDVLIAAATAGPTIPTAPDGAAVAKAIWGAAGQVFAATKGQGTTIVAVSPDMYGVIGPIFPPINPTNAYSSGFSTPSVQGSQGSIAGLSVVMSAGLDAGTVIVYSTAAAKAFEYKYGNLQVVEPSVWGVQVGYAGDFDAVVIEPAGVVRVTVTP